MILQQYSASPPVGTVIFYFAAVAIPLALMVTYSKKLQAVYSAMVPKDQEAIRSHSSVLAKAPRNSPESRTQVENDKQLYHQLQNLYLYPDCLPEARQRLVELFDLTLYEAQTSQHVSNTILSISEYSHVDLHKFLAQAHFKTTEAFESYNKRRRTGGPREMFPTREYAKYWLRMAAPVKYVDGSWLGGLHRVKTTVPAYRAASKIGWQILSEELGDGDLTKNHVWVYEELIRSISADSIGRGDDKKFISNIHNPNSSSRIWRASVAQLLVSLFPDEFFPEILGFNMSYESLPLHLLVTIQELKELDLDPYYFVLHVSIDNGHSGHAAMGAAAVTSYIDSLDSPEDKELAWKRVQAGFILAEGLPTTPAPLSENDKEVEAIFEQKCETSRPMHVCCPAKIGGATFGKSLGEWLHPKQYKEHSMVLLKVLEESRWVTRGSSKNSKLIKELKWGGRMFGAYTNEEVKAIEAWIDGMKDPLCELERTRLQQGTYQNFTGKNPFDFRILIPRVRDLHPIPFPSQRRNIRDFFFPRNLPELLLLPATAVVPSSVSQPVVNKPSPRMIAHDLATLLILSATPLEHFPSYPSKISCPIGMASIITLRALYGFLPETENCAGMDEVLRPADEAMGVVELGLHLGGSLETSEPLVDSQLSKFQAYLSTLSRLPDKNIDKLVGMQLGFVQCLLRNKLVWGGLGLLEKDRARLDSIGRRCISAWKDLITDGTLKQWEDIIEGFILVMDQVLAIHGIKFLDEMNDEEVCKKGAPCGTHNREKSNFDLNWKTDDIRALGRMKEPGCLQEFFDGSPLLSPSGFGMKQQMEFL